MKRPTYRRHNSRDKAFAQLNRKRHYFPGRYKSPESIAGYRAFLREHGFDAAEPVDEKPVSVAALAKAFVEWANATYPPGVRSEAANCRAAIAHLIRLDADTPLREYGPLRLKALQRDLAEQKKSRTYINSVCSRIKRAFRWGVSEELLPASVYQALATVPGLRKGRTAATEPAKRQPVKWEHIEPVLPQLSATVRAMVLLQWHTGTRSQSVCMARASQFDRSQQPWVWRPKHKTEHLGHELTVFVGAQAQNAIRPLFDGRDFLFEPRHLNGKRAKGYRSFYDSVSYLRAVRRAIERVNRKLPEDAKIPHWTPHQLRHAKATLVRDKYGLEAAQAALGHSRLSTTELYARKALELAKKVAEESG